MNANLDAAGYDPWRIAVVVGSSQGVTSRELGGRREPDRLSRLADDLGSLLGFDGLRVVVSTACTASTHALVIGRELLACDAADAVLVGGVDVLTPATVLGFDSLHALASKPCSPYHRSDGLSLGEGAGAVVLESDARAKQRGAIPLAQLIGTGCSSDAYHAAAPEPGGEGALLAIYRALRDAGAAPSWVSYINGHGTGTRANDAVERLILSKLFRRHDGVSVPVSSTKSIIGHTLGACGIIEAAVTAQAIQSGTLPPTLNASGPAPGLDTIPNYPRQTEAAVALSVNFAFGGNNAAILMSRADHFPVVGARTEERAEITGVGCVLSSRALDDWARLSPLIGKGTVTADGFATRRTGRDRDSSRFLADATQAIDVALSRSSRDGTDADDIALVVACDLGDVRAIEDLEQYSAATARVPPRLFSRASPSSPAGQLSIEFGLRGPCLTICGSSDAAVSALGVAARLVSARNCRAAIAVVGSEHEGDINEPGCVAMIVEPSSAVGRRAYRYAAIRSFAGRGARDLGQTFAAVIEDACRDHRDRAPRIEVFAAADDELREQVGHALHHHRALPYAAVNDFSGLMRQSPSVRAACAAVAAGYLSPATYEGEASLRIACGISRRGVTCLSFETHPV